MAFPFGPAPTLREIIERAAHYGAVFKQTPFAEGPDGPIRFDYLWIDRDRFCDLPYNLGPDDRLLPEIVDYIARRLHLPTDYVWPGFQGFDD